MAWSVKAVIKSKPLADGKFAIYQRFRFYKTLTYGLERQGRYKI